jgi:DNA polymerase III alpha subunit
MKIIEDTNDVIHTADYFLFNYKNVDLAVNKYDGVLTRGGRGSCGSFYINRILGMTQLDRFKINLPMFPDRFASTARLLENRALPDIDYNVKSQEPFVSASRELLGEHGCYPMIAYGCMQMSEAFRNVCRSKDIPHDEYNEVAKNIEDYFEDEKWKPIIEEANKYVGTVVSASVHPCAHLLYDGNLMEEYGVIRVGENICVMITSLEADEYKFLKNDYLIVKVWKLIDETFKAIGTPIIDANELLGSIKMIIEYGIYLKME